MNAVTVSIVSIVLIFVATLIGAASVFGFKARMSGKTSDIVLGFASGVMIAAAIFGLLIPAMEQGEATMQELAVFPVVVGFIGGGLFLYILDRVIPHFHKLTGEEEGPRSDLPRQFKFFLAVTLHNIPEGMAVGFACAVALQGNEQALITAALALAIGIAIQNIPEGAAISIPMLSEGVDKPRAFLWGAASGAVEPIGAVLAIGISSVLSGALPWLLALSAGAMFYATFDDLLPGAKKSGDTHYGLWAFMVGFALMMALEILL